jgi:membrane associated rhomboid family serine protease
VARRRGDLSTFFTFGGRVPASVGLLLALMLVASIAGWTNPRLALEAALMPVAILRGQIWRLVTWPFFQDDPLTLLFAGLLLWQMGQQLSYAWSERTFVIRFLVYTVGSALGATLLALVWENATAIAHVGIWPVVMALVVAWSMLFPDRPVNIWGVLPVTGRMLALLVTFGTVLYAIARGFAAFTPHLVAIGIAWAQARGLGARSLGRHARQWWAEREQRRRTKHLKVIRKQGSKDGSDDRSRWLN